MTILTEPQKKRLRAKGHDLKPVVMIGNKGLTENVMKEIANALEHHELIKIKAAVGEREERDAVFQKIVDEQHAILVQRVGNMGLFFKRNGENAKIKL
ncbi:MAG: ribosome assembly RNA-binding protein YhbY [Gammaproteobacteria bacterium]|nr:ribosome assembly RNA-binding protein YhbY [Gammaproteobacteria bacterium]NNC97806.1 ribosome assembly RNA-binding protein YhbY [Gammaproteobacteria bacterium]NNM13733.1 ribosome assembly RNA-binding protein YhbY [Gammaproteobacteria bacterium]